MDKIDEVLTRGVEKIYPSRPALEKVLRSGKKIKLYQGFDPSMTNLHLGNLVGILKLKQFQNLGHQVIFLVGDFTGMIGDPTDRASTRTLLTRKQVLKNSQTWKKQAGKILNFNGKNPAKLMFNSQWGDRITFKDLITITSKFTVQQMLERDFFQRRLKAQKPIHLHEFLYPVAQAIDCVEMDVNLEIGGSDQTFNMLAGRTLMKALKGKEKFVLTTKLLVDVRGEKAGKTTGNALFLNASATEMYGGIMSFSDINIIPGFELLTRVPLQLIKEHQKTLQKSKGNPMTLKKQLAFEVAKMLYGEKNAKNAEKEFERVFQKRKIPKEIPTFKVQRIKYKIVDLLTDTKLAKSRSEAKRLIGQGGVDIDGSPILDPQTEVTTKEGMVIRYGKRRFIRIRTGKN
ncbi:tyrosine--tRNA ligase [Microgenomates bacterium DG_75]|nr:MAG: tyrosine--tRNA ligase [Microgenomates bacterium DG_75]